MALPRPFGEALASVMEGSCPRCDVPLEADETAGWCPTCKRGWSARTVTRESERALFGPVALTEHVDVLGDARLTHKALGR